MTAREYLEQIQDIDEKINQDLERLAQMKEGAQSAGAIDYAKDRVQTSPVNTLEKAVCNYVTLDEYINDEVDRFVDAREQVIREIRELHNKRYTALLYKKYVQYKDLSQIAAEMRLSCAYVRTLHTKGLKAFAAAHPDLKFLT